LRSGAPSRDLPDGFEACTICCNRFVSWRPSVKDRRLAEATITLGDEAVVAFGFLAMPTYGFAGSPTLIGPVP
jgi:hypothetical protein